MYINDTFNQLVASVQGNPGDQFFEGSLSKKIEGTKILFLIKKKYRQAGSKFQY
jgi:hypothetical protein